MLKHYFNSKKLCIWSWNYE